MSNHPPQILKQLTAIISERLSINSSRVLIYNESKHQYEDPLSKSGFKTELTYRDLTAPTNRKMTSRKRKMIWFNSPYNQNMSTNITKIFLKLVDKHFSRHHRLHKIFNRNIVKVCYSCMSNVQQLIKKYSNFIKNKKNKITLRCTYRDKNGCPLNGKCKTKNVIHKSTSMTKNNVKKKFT